MVLTTQREFEEGPIQQKISDESRGMSPNLPGIWRRVHSDVTNKRCPLGGSTALRRLDWRAGLICTNLSLLFKFFESARRHLSFL